MRILMCCGETTPKVVAGLQAKFKTGGIDFIMVNSISDIEDIYVRGEYFDRAIIIEHSWTDSYSTEVTEADIRDRLNKFVNLANKRHRNGMQYVFLASNNVMANIVSEEIMPIAMDSAILVQAKPYYVTFFAGMVTYDINNFPDEIVYKPEVIEDTSILEAESTIKKHNYAVIEEEDMSMAPWTEPVLHQGAEAAKLGELPSSGAGWDDDDYSSDDGELDYDPSLTGETVEEYDDSQLDIDNGFDGVGNVEAENSSDESFKKQYSIETNTDDNSYDSEDLAVDPLDDDYYTDEDEATTEEPQDDYSEEADSIEIPDDIPVSMEYTTVEDDVQTIGNEDTGGLFDDNDYTNKDLSNQEEADEEADEEEYTPAPTRKRASRQNIGTEDIKATLDAFASRGNSIVVTGMGGCGTSVVAYNLANTLSNIGYSVLLVDMDTIGKTQSYISKDNYECINSEPDSANLRAALNSTSGIGSKVAIVRPGFHLLTMGLGGDTVELSTMIDRGKLIRFGNLSKSTYNFIVYDIPFKEAVGTAQDITTMADNIITVVDSSNWGITKALVGLCNIPSADVEDVVLSRGQLLFNKYTGFTKVMGKKVKSAADVTKVMDFMVKDLVGQEPDYSFSNMHICGVINHDKSFEAGWYAESQYSDTKAGQSLFLELIKRIVFKR